jgi:hypothetical protein
MDVTVKAEYAYIYKTFLAVLWADQSKAFDTLHLQLGIEMPLRRLGIPERLITLTVNAKFGSWCMVATIYGPTEADWQQLATSPVNGINKLLPRADTPHAHGYDPSRGTTQGSKHGTSVFKSYFDWGICLHVKFVVDPAPYLGSDGERRSSLGNALADDSNFTNSSLEGSATALSTASLFFAFMGGCFNLDKTILSVLDWIMKGGTPTGKYKLTCPLGTDWDPDIHLPADIKVPDPRVQDRIDTARSLLAALRADETATLTLEWDGELTAQQVEQLLEDRIRALEAAPLASVQIASPDEPVKYLGVWLPISLRYGKALSEAKIEIDAIADALQCAAISPSQIAEVEKTVATQIASWRLKMTSLTDEQIAPVASRLTRVVKNKMHLCASHPELAFNATMHSGLVNHILVDRVSMLIRMLTARHPIAEAMRGSLWMLQRWVGSHTPVLEYEHVEEIGWNGTWIGALAISISRQAISVTGGEGIPLVREGDECLVDMVPVDMKRAMATGCWTHSIWRLSDLYNSSGDRVHDLFTGRWMEPAGWRGLVLAALDEWEQRDGALGDWRAEAIHDRRYAAIAGDDDGPVAVVRMGRPCDGTIPVTRVRPILRSRLARHSLDGDTTPEGWLSDVGGATCQCAGAGHVDACYVWADPQDDTPEWFAIEACELIPVAFATQDGTLRTGGRGSHATFLAIDETRDESGRYDVYPGSVPPLITLDVLDVVDAQTVMGVSFASDEISAKRRDSSASNWAHTLTQLTDTSIIYAYSDCSLVTIDGVTKLSYGWLTAGVADPGLTSTSDPTAWPALASTELDFSDLTRGAWGGGVVGGPQSDHSTARGEAFGVLAVLLFTDTLLRTGAIPPTARVWSFCDNKGDVDRFNGTPDVLGDHDLTGADPDMWALLFALKKRLGPCFRLTWQRSHPERRKQRAAYHRHNWGNDWSDELADRALTALRASPDRMHLGPALEWGAAWEGQLIVKDMRRSLRKALMAESFVHHLRVNRGWSTQALAEFPKRRWVDKLSTLGDAATAVVLNKMITGWLATLTVQARRQSDPSFSTKCRLCGDAAETNWHVLAECVHPTMVAARVKLMGTILKHVTALPIPEGVRKLVALNWLVGDTGALVNIGSDDELTAILTQWAPELACTVQAVDLRAELLWTSPTGPHGDDLRKWAFKGVLPAHWNSLLAQHGVPPLVADASLLSIEKQVCEVVPELWREFCAAVHQDQHVVARGTLLTEQVHLAFAAWEGPVPARLREDVLKWTPRRQRAWLTKVRRTRARRAQERAQRCADHGHTDAPDPQRRLTSYYRRKIVPVLLARIKGPPLSRRGTRFATEASASTRRRRPKQASLRDMGWSFADALPVVVQSPQPEAEPPLPESGVQPNPEPPAPPDPDPAPAATIPVATQDPEPTPASDSEDPNLRPPASTNTTAAPVPQPRAVLHRPRQPATQLLRATAPLTERERRELDDWQHSDAPATVAYRDTAGGEATLRRVNLLALLSHTAHLDSDIYEAFQATYGVSETTMTLPHTAPYAASFHQYLLSLDPGSPMPTQSQWTHLYRRATLALLQRSPAPGHRGICIPLHIPGHWVLLVLDVNAAAFIVYDSMAADGCPLHPCIVYAIGRVRAHLDTFAREALGVIEWGPTNAVSAELLAQQHDTDDPTSPGGDCMLFVCCWTLCLIAGITPDIHSICQCDMRAVRLRLLHTLVAGPDRNCRQRLGPHEPHERPPTPTEQPLLLAPLPAETLRSPKRPAQDPGSPAPKRPKTPDSPHLPAAPPPVEEPRPPPPRHPARRPAPTHDTYSSAPKKFRLGSRPATRKRKPGDDPHACSPPPPKHSFNKSNSTKERKQGHDPYG